jgi:integrase
VVPAGRIRERAYRSQGKTIELATALPHTPIRATVDRLSGGTGTTIRKRGAMRVRWWLVLALGDVVVGAIRATLLSGTRPVRGRLPRRRVRGLGSLSTSSGNGLPSGAAHTARQLRRGLRISEALALNETDVDERRGSLLVRHGKGDKRREAGMDQFGFEQLNAWLGTRVPLPPGPLFCVIDGSTRGRRWSDSSAGAELRHLAAEAGVGGGSRPTSSDMRMRSSSPAKGSRSTSSNASSATPTWARPRPTCRASTPAKSSTPSASDGRRPFPPPPDLPC